MNLKENILKYSDLKIIDIKEIVYDLNEDIFDVNGKTQLGEKLKQKGITKLVIEAGEPQDLEKGDKIRSSGWLKYGRGGFLNGKLYILDQTNGGGGHSSGTEHGFYWGVKINVFTKKMDPYEKKEVWMIGGNNKEKALFIKSRAGERFDNNGQLSNIVKQILPSIVSKL
jgi:hypothetical protein